GTNPKKKSGQTKDPEKQSKQDMIASELSKATSNVRIFTIPVNPFIIIILSLLVGIGIYSYFRNEANDKTREITTGEFITNFKGNEYARVEIKDSGTATGFTKSLNIVETDADTNDFSELLAIEGVPVLDMRESEAISIDEVAQLLVQPTLGDLIQAFTSPGEGIIEDVIVGENFTLVNVIGDGNNDKLSVEGGKKEFESALARESIAQKDIIPDVIPVISAGGDESLESFIQQAQEGAYKNIWILNGTVIGQLQDDRVEEHVIDYGALRTDFPQFLQNEDIDFDTPTVEITQVEEHTISFDLILQIFTMLFIGFLVFSILRGLNGGSKGLMQFGQSKAKMFFGKKPEVTFKDVAGVDSAKEELNEVVLFLKDPKRFLKLGARIPKGLLLVGPPGTGKTLLARAIAGEAGVPFFHTSGSEFEEMLVGAGASRVRDLFAKAKKASPALIFIDEIDAVARKRGTTVQSSSTEQTLNQILVEMDGFEKNANVIVIAATNRPDVLDPAILRPGRFDRRIVVELPDIKGREEILKIHAENKPFSKSVDLKTVARRTVGYSGADLENMLNESAIIVAKEGRKEIMPHDIEEAANRASMGRERKIERTKDELKKTAYHEAGHAIIAKLTPESDPVHRITIVSRGMALGVTMQLPERDKYSQSYTEMESRLRVLMGGRAAEEIMYGAEKITSGASNDIEKATSMARRMIKRFGYSKKLGLVAYGQSNELQYLGYGYGEQSDYSPDTARIIDEEVKRVIDEAYDDAVKILKKHKDLLEKISEDLMEKEVIEGEDFDKYFEGIE
ncbi:ATP-dependent zinc metalloprotease FtsH, partial [Candidatus Dojkabacteria bacterium]|nr:ATP-dependent zinc metalloprotease FtsH [Candidatus Dojkabacteria bacterium]